MDLRFSDHARARMVERSIDSAEVAAVLDSPTSTRPSNDAYDRIVVIGTTPTGRVLMVVITGSDPTVVVTVAERRAVPRR